MQGLRTQVLFVDDLAAATDWYRKVTGCEPYYNTPYYVGFEVDGYELGLHPSGHGQGPGIGGDRCYWGTADAAAEMARLLALGATLLEKVQDVGGGIQLGAVKDPFGNALGFIHNPNFHRDVVQVVGPGERMGAAVGDLSERQIGKEIVVPATVAKVWELWTTSAGMASWLVADAHIELRIGGAYELYFMQEAPVGSRGSEGCRVLSFLPHRMLSFTWNAPPHHAETRPQRTWVVVEFEALPEGARVRVSHLGWPAAALAEPESAWRKTYDYFEAAWGGVLASLSTHLSH